MPNPDELLTPTEADVLPAMLGAEYGLTRYEVVVEGIGVAAITRALGTLEAKGLVRFDAARYHLTTQGRATAVRLADERTAALRQRRRRKDAPDPTITNPGEPDG